MKTHAYLSLEEHRKECPRLNKYKGYTMICEDCKITKNEPSKFFKGAIQVICDLEKLR